MTKHKNKYKSKRSKENKSRQKAHTKALVAKSKASKKSGIRKDIKLPKKLDQFESLISLMDILLGADGCEWMKSQTHQSLSKYAIEETFELVERIEEKNVEGICDELGDVLLQVVFHAHMAKLKDKFTINDVIQSICKKLIRRRPHIFANTEANNISDIERIWEEIKKSENVSKNSVFKIPSQLPALQRAHKIGEKTNKYKFDWQNTEQVWDKVQEEIDELKLAIKIQDKNEIVEEMGDLLFTIAQLSRHLNIEPEQALRLGNKKFEQRFENMLKKNRLSLDKFTSLSPIKKELLWRTSKQKN